MKAIKLSMVALATLFTFGLANAQFGVQAGYNMKTSSIDANTFQGKAFQGNGFHVGPTYELGIRGPFSLQSALLYNFSSKTLVQVLDQKATSTSHSLDIPLRAQVAFPISTGMNVFLLAGPNFNIGLAHKVSGGGESADLYKEAVGDYSRFDVQLGVGAGLKYNNMGLRFSYDFGLMNRVKDVSSKVSDLKIGLFYNF